MTVIATRDQVPQLSRPALPGAVLRPAAGQVGAGITGRDVLRILRKRKWLIAISVFVFLVAAAVATQLWLSYAPLYSAEALLVVRPPKGSAVTAETLPPKDVMERVVMQHAHLAGTRPVLDEAIRNVEYDVQRTSWFARDKTNALQRLMDEVRISPNPDRNIIRVSFADWNKDDVAVIANAVALAAEKNAMNLASGERMEEINRLESQLAELNKKLAGVRSSKQAARPTDIPFVQERINILSLELQALIKNITDLSLAETQAKSDMQAIETLEREGRLQSSPEVLRVLELDPMLRQLQVSKVALANEYESLRRTLGDRHRTVQDRLARLETVEKQITDREKELVQIQSRAIRQMAASRLEMIRAQLFLVREQLQEKKIGSKDLEGQLQRLKDMEDEEKSLQERINKFAARSDELKALAKNEVPMQLGNRAYTPFKPSWPQWKVMIPMGVLLGLMVGLGLAFLLELVDTSVKSAADISRRTDLPVLGMIPHADDIEDEIADLRLAFQTNPNSLVCEAFRQIRTCLLFSGPASQRRSLVVTSPQPQDGRTTVAVNLAAAMARGHRKVLVVDANFRQPMIRRLFPQCPQAGLSNALVGETGWRDAVAQVEPNLAVMASGPMPPNPAELLQSEQMRQLIAELTAEYDQVIFDTAPCLIVSDAAALAAQTDGVILAVRAGVNTHGIVQRSRDTISRVGAHIVGVALNGVRTTVGGYLRKHYESFYEYHEQDHEQGRERDHEDRQELPAK